MFYLFETIPGVSSKIPGVPLDYIPEKAAAIAVELFNIMKHDAFLLLGVITVIAIAISVVGLGEKWNVVEAGKKIVASALILIGINFIFGAVISVGHGLAEHIISSKNISQLEQDAEKAAKAEQERRGVANTQAAPSMFGIFSNFLGNIGSTVSLDLVGGLAVIAFYVSSVVINLLWRLFVIILYVTGPIIIVLLPIPGIGIKALSNWFAALIQLSFWQVWFAICAIFVRTVDLFSISQVNTSLNGNLGAPTGNHVEAIAYAVIFTILYLGTPFVVNAILPISSFSTQASLGLLAGTKIATTAINTITGGLGLAIPNIPSLPDSSGPGLTPPTSEGSSALVPSGGSSIVSSAGNSGGGASGNNGVIIDVTPIKTEELNAPSIGQLPEST